MTRRAGTFNLRSLGFAARAARAASSEPPPARSAWSRSVSSAFSLSASGSRYPRRSRLTIRAWASSSLPSSRAIRASPVWAAGRSGSNVKAELYLASAAFKSVASSSGRMRGDPFGRRRQEPVEPRADHRLGLQPDEAVDHPAVAHAEDGRNRPDAELRRQFGLPLGVDLGQHELAVVLLRQLLQQRAQLPARAAPLSPEVDHDRHGMGTLEHVLLEVLECRFDQVLGRQIRVAHQ